MSIIIGADIVPTKSNFDLFEKGDALELVGQELLDILNKADYRIFNLEVPLTDTETPIPKCGPNLIAPCNTVNGLKALGVDLLTLANNHILDQDVQGLDSTRKALDEYGIAYLGVGITPKEAAKPYIFENAEKKIGVYACAEHEFSIVSDKHPGANPYDPLESFDHVERLKEQCDFVIVLYHGGKEHYRYPSPNLQKVFRKFADKGADLVIAQHTHCIGCMEEYNGSTLVYGQGNFLFDDCDNEFWQTSLLISVSDDFSITYIPVEKKQNTIRLAKDEQADAVLKDFYERNQNIQENGFVEKEYQAFADSMRNQYLYTISPKWVGTRVLNRLLGKRFTNWYVNQKYKEKQLLALHNFIECEAHRELILSGLSNHSRKRGTEHDIKQNGKFN